MTQEEKQLLLKDLCSRLPYGVKINIMNDYTFIMEDMEMLAHHLSTASYCMEYRGLRPYLRPMSSMTEEEKTEYATIIVKEAEQAVESFTFGIDGIDWLNEHHFDYRGLIPMGLALEAPKGMYKTE